MHAHLQCLVLDGVIFVDPCGVASHVLNEGRGCLFVRCCVGFWATCATICGTGFGARDLHVDGNSHPDWQHR